MASDVVKAVPLKTTSEPEHFVFLLLDNFTMMALASAVEPLRMANQLTGRELYRWTLVSADGGPVRASDGISVTPDMDMNAMTEEATVMVIGGVNITRSFSREEVSWLQLMDRRHMTLGGICTGAYVLAHAQLLNSHDCSSHWECMAAIQEQYPKVNCNSRLFSIDRKRITCSGGAAPMDLMLYLIAGSHGSHLSSAISDMFVCDRVRTETDQQKVPLRHMLHSAQPKLVEIVELMEANIEEPIELSDLASFVGISRRQLERLFHQYLHCTPSRYYLKLRLDRARQLLKQTNMSVIDISAACGFVSTPHFSRCYRKYIGLSPRQERMGFWNDRSEKVTPFKAVSGDSVVVTAAVPASPAFSMASAEPSFASVQI